MAFVPVPHGAFVEVIGQIFQQTVENTLWIYSAEEWDTTSLLNVAQIVADWWGDNIAALVSDSFTLSTVRATAMYSQYGPTNEYLPTIGNIGLKSSPALPLNVTLAIKFGTPFRGRSFRGRNFVVGLCENMVTGNEIIVSDRDGYIDAYNALPAALAAADYSHMVCSRRFNGADRGEGVLTGVTFYSADTFIDSQRRRLTGRGQ